MPDSARVIRLASGFYGARVNELPSRLGPSGDSSIENVDSEIRGC
jgi:hypothetical protein